LCGIAYFKFHFILQAFQIRKDMSKRLPLALLLVLIFNALSAQHPQTFTNAASPAEVGFSADRLARLDTLLQGYVDRGVVPCVATFVARKGKIVHHKAFGFSNLERKIPARADDIYRIMSQTKLITTVGLMMLMEEGKFYLDQPIHDFLPQFKNPRVLVSVDDKDKTKYLTRAAKSEITFRHLLSHTAGIPYDNGVSGLPEFQFPYFASTSDITLEQVIDKLAKRPLESDPGEKFVYGLNTDVAGRLIEVLSGKNLSDYLRERVCEPLGMPDTWFYLPKEKAPRLVGVYSQEAKSAPLKRHAYDEFHKYPVEGARKLFMGGAGMSSTVSDYARICQLILNKGEFNGKRLLAPATVEMMTANQIGDNFVWDRMDKFGLGLQIFSPNSHYGDNATAGALMWGGYFCTEYTIDPKRELVMLVYTNMQPFAQGTEVLRKFRIMVYAALTE
jgi:CubicO group peptidase (beta-lactamase class C family)